MTASSRYSNEIVAIQQIIKTILDQESQSIFQRSLFNELRNILEKEESNMIIRCGKQNPKTKGI